MAQERYKTGPYALKTMGRNEFLAAGRFDTNTDQAPDGVTGVTTGVAVARSAQAVFTVTFSPAPAACVAAGAEVWGDQPGINAKIQSFSSGVLTIKLYDEDAGGIDQAAGDVDNVTVCWWAVFTSET